MKIRHQEIDIPIDGTDPFVNCKLERKKYSEVLTTIVEGYAEGFVLAIDNKWGTGKTTFVKMWQQHLINEGFQTLYFNAWENDFQKEVIIALLSELSELRNKSEATFKNVVEKGARFLKKVAPAVAKGVASKAIGNEAVTDIITAVTEFTTEELESEIKDFTKSKDSMQEFRRSLETFAEAVNSNKPIVFIIDELDRCRPSYAVEVLEQIKHLFSVPGIVFVLSIDKIQLGNAVRGFYGSDEIDAPEYLRRFIDLEYVLPSPDRKLFVDYLYNYFGYDEFLKSTERTSFSTFRYDEENFKSLALLFFEAGNFRLRGMEKLMAKSRIVLRSFSYRQYVFPDLLILLIFLNERQIDIYNEIKNCSYSFSQFTEIMDSILVPLKTSDNQRKLLSLLSSVLVRYANEYQNVHYRHQEVLIDRSNGGAKLTVQSKLDPTNQTLLNAVEMQLQNIDVSDVGLSYILKKIDLTENLVS
jgi:hypothetical protein